MKISPYGKLREGKDIPDLPDNDPPLGGVARRTRKENTMSTIRVSDLSGVELDYWVARAWMSNGQCWFKDPQIELVAGKPTCTVVRTKWNMVRPERPFRPSTDWNDCGPLIERMHYFERGPDDLIHIQVAGCVPTHAVGETKTAICRAVVASKYGEEFDPESIDASA